VKLAAEYDGKPISAEGQAFKTHYFILEHSIVLVYIARSDRNRLKKQFKKLTLFVKK